MSFNYLSTARKSKRSQSALEYMMTYGWAILIIVIVAVILYSMGIFNPSSSITFTSSGFSPFTVSSSLCNNIGYKIAVLAGPIPNNANSITINKVFLTSATGANTTTASYTLTNPVTLKSGQSATILIPNVACNSANIHYSLSAKIQYSYDVPTIGLQTVNTTGTVAGTSITGKPSTLTSYEPITITNSQSSATPSPFQQMVNFTSSDNGWTSISTGNFGQNVEFFYYNGTVIPSWLENYTSTNAIWWLKIAAIPGGSSETVYVGFAPKATNLFNTVNDGEAPQLTCPNPSDTASCSTYAEYDDGANVFNFYDNFSGTSLNKSKFNVSSLSYSVDNGLTLDVPGSGFGFLYSIPSFSAGSVFDFYGKPTFNNGANGFDFGAGDCINCNPIGDSWMIGANELVSGYYLYLNNTKTPTNYVQAYGVWTVGLESSGTTAFSEYNYSDEYTVTNSTFLPHPISYQLLIHTGTSGNTFLQWFDERSAPPNGVMPSVIFGGTV